jgi:phosphatidylserine/phosphatidylglycerophosphate/cardiolipin synthase-like enzyme/uncharacterized membrane protein YdjX (TVP38/TMEM64 family)
MLVDADAYFKAIRSAIRAARHSIFILSWDIDSRMRLVPAGANDGYPEELGEFLHAVISDREALHAYVLNWDFAMLYALEREWLPAYKLGWRTHRRLAFKMDGRHPVGASHHQKVVVVDDALAFVGGLDLTCARWDTPSHQWGNPLRLDANSKLYDPFHDVQAVVDGNAAKALGDLCRMRWHRATSQRLHSVLHPVGIDIWPDWLLPDLREVDVGISRTEPSFEGQAGVTEIRQLHLDAIAAARSHLFFENQYFTSGLIADALAERLSEFAGPEVVIVSPQKQSGWLEEATMGVLRARLQQRLRRADLYDRYRLFCPMIPNQDHGCLNVHSKVFAVDNRLFSIGSANLSNRSMVCDTECNLSIEAQGVTVQARRIAADIARLRSRLLAEHLDSSVDNFLQLSNAGHSLIKTIMACALKQRRLQQFEPLAPPELDALIPQQALFDPEQVINPEQLVRQLVPEEAHKPLPRRMAGLVLLALLLTLMALAWRFTPLHHYVNPASLTRLAQQFQAMPLTPLLILLTYVIGGFLMIPVTLLIALTGLVFGPLPGALYALAGSLLSAAAGYGTGYWLGSGTVQHMLGSRINRLTRLARRSAKRGILTVMVIRMLPLAPFSVVNIVAGASPVKFRDYLIGTALGLLPGILLMTTFAHNLLLVIRNPRADTVAVLLIVVLLLVAFALLTESLLSKSQKEEDS